MRTRSTTIVAVLDRAFGPFAMESADGGTLANLTLDSHDNRDDVDSDDSDNSDGIDQDFYIPKEARAASPQHRQSSSPSSRPISPNTPSPGVKRRMSLARPVVNHLSGVVVNEKADSAFLHDLTVMITEFPIPPSHIHSRDPQQSSLADFVGISSLKSLAGTWRRK